MLEFNQIQQNQLIEKGISVDMLFQQIERFKTGMTYSSLDRPATVDDGILAFSPGEMARYVKLFDEKAPGFQLQKFVPASGAATRMFKDLYDFLDLPESAFSSFDALPETLKTLGKFLPQMPFWEPLQQYVEEAFPCLVYKHDPVVLKKYIAFLLADKGLQYGYLPKALLLFHRYKDKSRMPFEEHLVEWGLLNSSGSHDLNLHFTLSPHHVEPFQQALRERLPAYYYRFDRSFVVEHSLQHPSTDTVGVDENNNLILNEEGELLFRPGGHGALLYNLNGLEADLVFLKNIDNVATESVETGNIVWKKLLGGLLMEVMHDVHQWLYALEKSHYTPELLQQAVSFIEKRFGYAIDPEGEDLHRRVWGFLNRPIRVCGMVKNTGEPGGGPFWVKQDDGTISLQIVESAQINMEDPDQKAIAGKATHFNPVDLVCNIRDYKKEKFDLNQYADPNTSFISIKSHQGRVLKALEHPGLWNGAMANWITLFVEVPLHTFNPVKTVHDLLRPEHFRSL